MATDQKLSQLIINEMTKAQYDALGTSVKEDEIYVLTDAETAIKTDGTTIQGDGTSDNPISIAADLLQKIDDEIESREENDEEFSQALSDLTTDVNTHVTNKNNPHSVTKTQIGLGNVDNTSDLNKPISTATQTALDLKANKADVYTQDETDTAIETALEDYVTFSDYATNSQPGIILPTDTYSIAMEGSQLYASTKALTDYTNGQSGMFISKGTLENIKYNIVKQGVTANTISLTDNEKLAARTWIDAVGSTDYATSDVAGVIKQSTTYGFSVNENTGVPFASTKDLTGYQNGDGNMFIGKNTLENIKDDFVKRGVTENAIALTDTEKSAARTWIGAGSQTDIDSIEGDLSGIEAKIPTTASTTNLLADREYVNNAISDIAAFYITSNEAGDAFATKAALLAGPYYFQGEVREISLNDYAIVIADETKNMASSRYMYDGKQWDFQYIVNDTPFTQEQLDAINSTATKTKIESYSAHIIDTSNPHAVTKAQLGLGNVDNTTDLNKPISTATQEALDDIDEKISTHTEDVNNPHQVTKTQLGLGNVDNTSDVNKPISTATQAALDLKANAADYVKKSGDIMTGALEFRYDASKVGPVLTPATKAGANGLKICPNPTSSSGIMVSYNGTTNKIYPVGDKNATLGETSDAWHTVYTNNLHAAGSTSGTLIVPTQAGTLARIEDIPEVPVSSVNSKVGDVVLSATDINATAGDQTVTIQAALNLKANASEVYTKEEVNDALDDKLDSTVASNTYATITSLNSHTNNKSNPHEVTKAQVGLGNVDNTSDLAKPISLATQTALDKKQNTLTAGTNITIDGATISAKDTTYSAGAGINIDKDGVISNTYVSGEWGKITGTLANQTDLQNALNAKANTTDIPVNVSELTNDSGYITASSDITGNAATATKLANKRTIALTGDVTGSGTFDGSANLSMSTTVIGNLHNHGVNQIKTQDEGGYNWSAGSVDMITRQSIGSARSNKSFNLPAEQIVIEYSQDGGQTWIAYPCTDEEKRGLFTETRQKIFYLGGTADIATKSLDWQLRVTAINGKTLSDRYVTVDGIYMWASTAGNKFYYKLERSLNGTPDTWEEVFDNQQLSGWSGNNIRYIPTQNWGSTSTTNTYSLRMTFFMTELSSGYAASTVSDIRLLGTGYYSGANEVVKSDRLFKIDTSLNAEFPANVKATLFDGASSQTKAVEWHQGTENAASYVWFSDSSSTTALGKPVWTTSFKYNPTSDTLTVGNITGNAATATNATNHIKDSTVHVTSTDKTTWSGKQDKLTAGTNISITNNVIGLTGTIGDDNLPNRLKGTLTAISSITEDAKLTGFYGSDSGTPFDNSTKFSIMSTNYDYHISQLAQSYDSRELAYRTGDNDGWSEWRYVAWADEVALKQDKLTAGNGIDITDNTISVTLANVPWGNITGDITKQTDLIGVLSNKQNKLVAGTNIEVSGANISTTATRITIRDWSDL